MANIISVGPNLSKKERHRRKVQLAVGVFVAVIVLFLIGYGVWYAVNQKTPQSTKKEVMHDIAIASYDRISKGDYEGASQVYANAAEQAVDKQEKQQIYLQQASMALSQNKLEDALSTARLADQAKPSLAVSQMIAIIAEKKGDKELAVSYLKRALSQLDTNSPMYSYDQQQIKDKIVSLGGSL